MNAAALASVLHYLSVRDRSLHEIEVYLAKRLDDQNKVEATLQIIEYLQEHDLVNDRKFAGNWTQAKLKRFYGPRKIRADLMARGVPAKIISDTLETIEPSLWLEAAAQLLAKYGHKWVNLPKFNCFAKAANFLAARGFTPSQARVAVDQWYQKAVK